MQRVSGSSPLPRTSQKAGDVTKASPAFCIRKCGLGLCCGTAGLQAAAVCAGPNVNRGPYAQLDRVWPVGYHKGTKARQNMRGFGFVAVQAQMGMCTAPILLQREVPACRGGENAYPWLKRV